MNGAARLIVRDEELLLHPERAVLWPRRKTVIVADTHFGKSSFFGRHGIAVPAGSDDADRARLTKLVAETSAERLIILGDFLHAPMAFDSRDAHDLGAWLQGIASVQVTVVAGNHDRGAPRQWPLLAWRDGEWLEPPFCFVHEAPVRESLDRFTLSGHTHPVIRLKALRKHILRVPVFWQRRAGLVLPSFGAFTGGFAVQPGPGEHVFAVSPTAVAQVG